MYGYDKLPERLLPLELPEPKGNRAIELEDKVRDLLADQGLQEAITYSLTSVRGWRRSCDAIRSHPQGQRWLNGLHRFVHSAAIRSRLSAPSCGGRCCPELLTVAHENLKTFDSVALYELGFVYLPKAGEKLPDEPRRLAVVLCGRRSAAAWDDPQGVKPGAVRLLRHQGCRRIARDRSTPARREFPAASSATVASPRPRGGTDPGREGPSARSGSCIRRSRRTSASASARSRSRNSISKRLLAAVPERFPYKPFSIHPPAKRDVAVVVPADTPAEKVLAEIRVAGGEPARRRGTVRPLHRRGHSRRHQEPRVRADVPGTRPARSPTRRSRRHTRRSRAGCGTSSRRKSAGRTRSFRGARVSGPLVIVQQARGPRSRNRSGANRNS